MEITNWREKIIRNKKVLLALAGLGVLVAAIVWSLSKTSSSRLTQPAPLPTPNFSRFRITIPTQVPPTSAQWPIYKSAGFSFNYPTDWNVAVVPFRGGESVIVRPTALPAEEFVPSLIVETSAVSGKPVDERASIYLQLGFVKSSVTLNNSQLAIKINGTFPAKVVGGKSVNSPIQETHFYIERPSQSVVIKHMYDGDKPDSYYENLFDQILSTFTFN